MSKFIEIDGILYNKNRIEKFEHAVNYNDDNTEREVVIYVLRVGEEVPDIISLSDGPCDSKSHLVSLEMIRLIKAELLSE